MRLSPRLEKIANLVPNNSIVADIGTDHGFIPKHLVDEGISKLVIATDISKGSLQKTINYIVEENLQDSIDTRLGDGLEPIGPFEADTLIIAGMGGMLIAEILERSLKTAKTFNTLILQPMVGAIELRRFLVSNGFRIVDEELVREGDKFYEIIVANIGLQKLDKEIDYEISPILIKKDHPLWRTLVVTRINMIQKIIDTLEDSEGEKGLLRLRELNEVIEDYREVLSD